MKVERMMLLCALINLAIFFAGCRKDLGPGKSAEPGIDTTTRNTRIGALTREVADILEEVYRDHNACREVVAAIQLGYYEDERVLLKDLLFPALSKLYTNEIFQRNGIDTGVFRRRFCSILEKGDYPLLNGELKSLLVSTREATAAKLANQAMLPPSPGVLSPTEPVVIYFPYSENFPTIITSGQLASDNKIAILLKPTIVFSDREADVAPGRDPYYCPGSPGNLCYRQVSVDDNYATANPTHIVTIGAVIKETTVQNIPKTELVHRVYHGYSRLTKQMDRLVSFTGNGGGSEIKVCRVNGYLRTSEDQITDFSGDVVTLYYTRGEIRNRLWKRVYSVWDPNWNYQDIEQIYAVYEDDTRGTRSIDGTLRTSLTVPGKLGKVEGDIGFKITASTQDEIITQRKLDRKSYFRDGLNNQGWGYIDDPSDFLPVNKNWPVYDGGSIWHYTLPYRIY